MDVTLLANNSQHYWMLHVASVCTPCCTLLGVVEQNLKPVKLLTQQAPNISLVPWSPKRNATTLDPFLQPFRHGWGHARALHMVSKVLWVVSFPRCTAGPSNVRSCCTRLQTTTNTDAKTPYIVSPTMLRVVVLFPRSLTMTNCRSLTCFSMVRLSRSTISLSVGFFCRYSGMKNAYKIRWKRKKFN